MVNQEAIALIIHVREKKKPRGLLHRYIFGCANTSRNHCFCWKMQTFKFFSRL